MVTTNFEIDQLPKRSVQLGELQDSYQKTFEEFIKKNDRLYSGFLDSLVEPLALLALELGETKDEYLLEISINDENQTGVSEFNSFLKKRTKDGLHIIWTETVKKNHRNLIVFSFCDNYQLTKKSRRSQPNHLNYVSPCEDLLFAFDARLLTNIQEYLNEVREIVLTNNHLEDAKRLYAFEQTRHQEQEALLSKRIEDLSQTLKDISHSAKSRTNNPSDSQEKKRRRIVNRLRRNIRVVGGSYDSMSDSIRETRKNETLFDVESFNEEFSGRNFRELRRYNYPYEAINAFIKWSELTNKKTVYVEDLEQMFVKAIDSSLAFGKRKYSVHLDPTTNRFKHGTFNETTFTDYRKIFVDLLDSHSKLEARDGNDLAI